ELRHPLAGEHQKKRRAPITKCVACHLPPGHRVAHVDIRVARQIVVRGEGSRVVAQKSLDWCALTGRTAVAARTGPSASSAPAKYELAHGGMQSVGANHEVELPRRRVREADDHPIR